MTRTQLSEALHTFGCPVHFQPPPTIQLSYPCIIYERVGGESMYADNSTYKFDYRYTVMYIDPHPDSDIPKEIAKLPMCRMDQIYTADNLNHYIFTVY